MERYVYVDLFYYLLYLLKVQLLQLMAGVSILPEDIAVFCHSTNAVTSASSIIYL